MHHLSYGLLTPALAYAASYIGSLLGLMCAARARVLTGRARRGWLLVAAISLGGTGIWAMHFIAMLGVSLHSAQIRYELTPTAISALVAIVAVGAGLAIVGDDPRKLHRVAAAGVLTGAGVASMHYLGMAAMVMPADISYEPVMFWLSIVIAVVAATAALWFTLVIKGRAATLAAAAVMGVAVCGMHYTGMAAMRLTPTQEVDLTAGVSFTNLLLPLVLIVSVITVILLVLVAFSVSPAELVDDAQFEARLERRRQERTTTSRPHDPEAAELLALLNGTAPREAPSGGTRPRPTPQRRGDTPTTTRHLTRPPTSTRR